MGANKSVLADAKEILFAELSESVAHGVPLSEALGMIARPWGRMERYAPPDPPNRMAELVPTIYKYFLSLPRLILAIPAAVIYPWATFARNPSRVATIMADRLRGHVLKGLSLTEAMEKCGSLFEPEEVRLIEFGERENRMETAMRKLSEFHVDRRRAESIGGSLLYPFALLLISSNIAAFCFLKVIPKFQDIYSQLGYNLPGLTKGTIIWSDSGMLFLPLVLWPLELIGVLLVSAALLNGSALSVYRSIAFFLISVNLLLFFAPLLLIYYIAHLGPGRWGEIIYGTHEGLTCLLVGIVLLVLYRRLFLRLWETSLRYVERRIYAIGRLVPVVRQLLLQSEQARWLACLAMTLQSGMPLPEALVQASTAGPKSTSSKGLAVSQDVAGGVPLGESLEKHRFLAPLVRFRIRWLDRTGNLPEGLETVATESYTLASNRLTRATRVIEVVSVLMVGALVGIFVISIYLPIFNVPTAVLAMDLK